MNYIFLVENVVENKQNWFEYLSTAINIISTIGSIGIAYWALKLSDKQNKISKHQSDLEKCAIIYDSFIKEKQEKIIELRKLYLNFKDVCLYTISTIFPSCIGPKNQNNGEPPKINIDGTDVFVSFLNMDIKENKNTFLVNGKNYSDELLFFLNRNEVFLKDNQDLFNDLQTTSKVFRDFFSKIIENGYRKSLFIICAEIIDKIGSSVINIDMSRNSYTPIIRELRKFFYHSIFGLSLSRIGPDGTRINSHILHMTGNSLFKNKDIAAYTEENIKKWCQNETIAFDTHAIFITWFDVWFKYIDSFFSVSFNNINKVINDRTFE